MRDPFGLPFENRFSRILCCQFQILRVRLFLRLDGLRIDLPYAITVIGNSKVIFELVKTHLRWLTSVVEKPRRYIPRVITRNSFQRLGHV